MSINSIILNALKDVGVPVSFQTYSGTATTYITFFEYNQYPNLVADDEEIRTNHSIQVDIWSNGNYFALADKVKAALKAADFVRTFETDLYETETKTYHKVMRFSYVEEVN